MKINYKLLINFYKIDQSITHLTFKCKEVKSNTYLGIFYRMSSFFYAIAGILVFIFYNQMKEYDKTFIWILFGFMLLGQSISSYMADVVTWGKQSKWKEFDVYYASTLTFISGPIIIFRAIIGYASYPISATIIWSICVLFALFCKVMSSRSVRQNNCKHYLFWHGLWHCLPLYASVIILWLGLTKINKDKQR